MKLVLASGNPGKAREFQALLAPLAIEVLRSTDLGIEPPEETGTTFEDNALLKARDAAARAGLPALADDSGLEVDALGGRPGVYSARYAGPAARDEDNNALLLKELATVPDDRRTARYQCVLALVRASDDPSPLVVRADWPGTILRAPRGSGGFGYDPLFMPDGLTVSSAQLAPAEKNRLSHRGQALRRLIAALRAQPLA